MIPLSPGPGYSSYLWSTGETTEDLNGISAGTYTVTVTDSHGCTAVLTRTVTQPTALNPTIASTNVNCFGGNNGSINLTVGLTDTYNSNPPDGQKRNDVGLFTGVNVRFGAD